MRPAERARGLGGRVAVIAALVASAAALTLGPGTAHASTNCCFELAADVAQSAKVDYGNDATHLFNGTYRAERHWSIRSIVAFHETVFRHRPSLRDKGTEARLLTSEDEQLTRKTGQRDGGGNYIRERLKCNEGTDGFQGGHTQPTPARGAVSLPHEPNGYRLMLDGTSVFDSQPLQCPGGADFGLHRNLGAGVSHLDVAPPNRRFLRASSQGHKSHTFTYGPVSVTHSNVAGLHTFTGQWTATVKISWFPKSKLKGERNALHAVRCDPDLLCEKDHWGE